MTSALQAAPLLRVLGVETFVRDARVRFPFRFGNAVMDELEIVHLRVEVEDTRGGRAWGVSASVLSPLWFDKGPERSFEAKREALLVSLRLACDAARDSEVGTAWRLHREVEAAALAHPAGAAMPRLTAGFGVALVDSAVADAVCRLQGCTLHQALAADALGFGPLPGLPARPLRRLAVRHTVGLGDALRCADVQAPLDDGLPESLEAVLARYGHRWLKVKIGGDVPAACERLRGIAGVLGARLSGVRLTVDGNEQLRDLDACAALGAAVREDPRLEALWSRVAWVEQPLDRAQADVDGAALRQAFGGTQVILDEADADDAAVEAALARGYDGISAKNCKGLYRTLHSFRVVQALRAAGRPAVLSSEDLTNPAVVALQQDLAVAAALGIEHTERNAHHYVRGLAFLAEAEQAAALQCVPGLYHALGNGLVTLRIEAGVVDVAAVVGDGYGGCPEPAWDAMRPLALPVAGAR